MKTSEFVGCTAFTCGDVNHGSYIVPDVELIQEKISIVMIAEAAPASCDDYYAKGNPSFEQTTVQAFNDAGADVASVHDLLGMGIYLTTLISLGMTIWYLLDTLISDVHSKPPRDIHHAFLVTIPPGKL